MKLKKYFILSAVFSVLVGTVAAFAASTGSLVGPDVYSGTISQSSVYKLTSANYSSIVGTRAHFGITVYGWLRDSVCVPNDNRTVKIRLYEDDPAPNEDELVKTYTGRFTGNQLVSYELTTIHKTGNIDSAGDRTVELYVTNELKQVTGDRSGTNGELYYFTLSVD